MGYHIDNFRFSNMTDKNLPQQYVNQINRLDEKFPSGLDLKGTPYVNYLQANAVVNGSRASDINDFIYQYENAEVTNRGQDFMSYINIALEDIVTKADGDIMKILKDIRELTKLMIQTDKDGEPFTFRAVKYIMQLKI